MFFCSYCIKDDGHDDLDDITLLPLADHTYTRFSVHEHPVYVETHDHSYNLLKGMDDILLSDEIQADSKVFQKIIKSGKTLKIMCIMYASISLKYGG